MNDIPQWRRMIQPSRARTPAVEPDDSDGVASPMTPRRGLKPKISSYFTNHNNLPKAEPSFVSLNDDIFLPRLPAWPDEQPYPQPDAEGLIDSIMCRLMSDPYGSLDPRFNGMLLQIFENYRSLLDEKRQVQDQLDDEVHARRTLVLRLQQAQKQWSDERQEHKAEIKRLELVLAKGKRGLAEVTIARQDSHFRQRESFRSSEQLDDGLQTIFQFLERTKRSDEKAYGGQRAVLRPRNAISPSAKMKRLPQQLALKTSLTNVRSDLPFGTPPTVTRSTIAEASPSESQRPSGEQARTATGLVSVSEPKTSLSDDTFSTFSCIGDTLPENVQAQLPNSKGSDSVMTTVKRIGSTLARHRDVPPYRATPNALDECAHAFEVQRTAHQPAAAGPATFASQCIRKNSTRSASNLQKQPSMMAKASGFFQRLRPHPNGDPSNDLRFSFQSGDDDLTLPTGVAPTKGLRKSVSLFSLPEMAQRTTLSSVVQSPTTSAGFSDTHRSSRIPMPVYSKRSIARPRRDHEDSASSLHTTVGSRETIMDASYSPPRTDTSHVVNDWRPSLRRNMTTTDSTRLLDRSGFVRGNAFAAAAARNLHRAVVSDQSDCVRQRSCFTNAYAESDVSESTKENMQPIAALDDYDDE